MVSSKGDYTDKDVTACKAVLLEIIHLFGEIKDEIVVIGRWLGANVFISCI